MNSAQKTSGASDYHLCGIFLAFKLLNVYCSDNTQHYSLNINEFTTNKVSCENFLFQHLNETSLYVSASSFQTIWCYMDVLMSYSLAKSHCKKQKWSSYWFSLLISPLFFQYSLWMQEVCVSLHLCCFHTQYPCHYTQEQFNFGECIGWTHDL